MQIELVLEAEFHNTPPICNIRSKYGAATFTLLEEKNNLVKSDFDLQEDDFIEIEFHNKDDHDDNVIKIKKLKIDSIDLQHFIFNGIFTPIYNNEWYEKQNPKPPATYSPCTELRHKGTWKINIKLPIWKFMMEKWIKDER